MTREDALKILNSNDAVNTPYILFMEYGIHKNLKSRNELDNFFKICNMKGLLQFMIPDILRMVIEEFELVILRDKDGKIIKYL